MKLYPFLSFAALACLGLSVIPQSSARDSATADAAVVIQLVTDRKDAMYQVGESAVFQIEATQGGKPLADQQVQVRFSKDGVEPKSVVEATLVEGKASVKGTLDEAGFLLARVQAGGTTATASAAFDPLSIPPSMPLPDDFDAFWKAQLDQLAAVPVEWESVKVTPVQEGLEVLDVKVKALGAPVSGYLAKPAGAAPRSLPAILTVHGAGVGSANKSSAQNWAQAGEGMLALDINAHGIINGQSKEFYNELKEGDLKDYRFVGRDNREENYFKFMFLRLVRAIDFLTQQPEWDGKTVIVYGSSQGGYQALAATGLDPRVTWICAGVTAGADHTGSEVGRVNGWPKLVAFDENGQANAATVQTSRYFDCVNFALRSQAKGATMTVGFVDTVCPPTSVYAAYNALTIPKTIHADPLAAHAVPPAAGAFMRQAALDHAAAMKAAKP